MRKKMIAFAFCHPNRIARSKGLCQVCYSHQHHKATYQYKDKAAISEKKKLYNSLPEVKKRQKAYDRKCNIESHGITVDKYDFMLIKQDSKCAICSTMKVGRSDRELLYIDHNHATGKVRGLLCNNCNFGLGHFKDSPELLESAARYLREHLSS